jgi:TolB-like protein
MATPANSNHAPTPAPSLFISYASEDREVARRLRDNIRAHGIEVWYDEDELTGGDAWDKKIRDRIRACDYFMPLISKATEARREGYFRREWRQAAERTLDMSDDVMFLLPLNIDDISAYGARVPERFTQVQWTRCPGGEPNADLEILCGRMLRREDAAPIVTSTPPVSPPQTKAGKKQLPPYPPQPKRIAHEPAWLHAFNLAAWIVRCAYRAYRGFPRLLRWFVIAWFIVFLMGRCGGSPDSSVGPEEITDTSPPGDNTEGGDRFKDGLIEAAQELRNVDDLGGFGRIIGAVADAAQAGRPLALTPFAYNSGEATNEEFTKTVFDQLLRSIRVTRADDIAVSPSSLGANPKPADVLTRIARTESRFLLTGWVEIEPIDNSAHFEVALYAAHSPTPVWTQRYSIASADAATTVDDISAALNTQKVFATPTPPAEPTTPAPTATGPNA